MWRLSLWYVELVLLRRCKYKGNYADRLAVRHAGEVGPTPWMA